jgi:hypothetical protein
MLTLPLLTALTACSGPAPSTDQVTATSTPEKPAEATATTVTTAATATTQAIAPTPAPPAPLPPLPPLPGLGEAIRLRGDAQATKQPSGMWTSGTARTGDVLPVGYAPPTPPGAIDIKRYPSLRRAETSGSGNPRVGMNLGFFPLFNHIKRRNIAMTAPVEMDYEGWNTQDGKVLPEPKSSPDRWTMSFLYRTADLGPAGPDPRNENITVVDTPERLVIAIGYQGSYAFSRSRQELDTLAEWIAQDGRYEVIGEPRVLHYNGPEQRDGLKWGEVHLPVKPKSASTSVPPPGPGR